MIRVPRLVLLGIGLAALCGLPANGAESTVRVDPARRYQVLEGWGTSLAWMGKVIGNFPDPERAAYMDLIFDPVKGLGLNVVRYNIGGGENPALSFLPYRAAMEGFEPAAGRWDWNADAGQRWVLQQAIARGANIVEAFSNSPPYWMTGSGSVTGAKHGANNLPAARAQEFVDYLVTVTRHFHDAWGIDFRTLDPLNEPASDYWQYGNGQEGCHFDQGPDQTNLLQALAAGLTAAKLPTTVSAPDDNSIDETAAAVRGYDDATFGSVSQVNTHSYFGGQRAFVCQAAQAARKRLWMSEYGDGDGTGMTLALRIIEDMNELHPGAWVYWQVVDNGTGWAMLDNPEDGKQTSYKITEKYWVYANFTKFIRPGAVIIGSNDPARSLAAVDARAGTLTVVTANTDSAERTITYDLAGFPTSRPDVAAYLTSATRQLAPVSAVSDRDHPLTFVVPGASVLTVVFRGVKLP